MGMMSESQPGISPCECQVCIRHRRLRSVADKLSEDDARWLLDMGEEFDHIDENLCYYRSIVDGDWPSSVEILDRALERARGKHNVGEAAEGHQ